MISVKIYRVGHVGKVAVMNGGDHTLRKALQIVSIDEEDLNKCQITVDGEPISLDTVLKDDQKVVIAPKHAGA